MTAASSRSRRAQFAIATKVTLLPALAILAIQASPVSAQEDSYTLNVSTQGNGKVTAEGIDCGYGGSDCSETYPVSYQQVCEPNPDPPPARFCHLEPIYQEVTPTSSPAPGWQFQGWGGACSGTGPCALTMGQNHSVSATFIRVSPPNDDFDNAQPVSGTSVSVNGTNVNATREESDP